MLQKNNKYSIQKGYVIHYFLCIYDDFYNTKYLLYNSVYVGPSTFILFAKYGCCNPCLKFFVPLAGQKKV